MKIFSKAAALAVLLLGFTLSGAANAQTYPAPPPGDTPTIPTGGDTPGGPGGSSDEQCIPDADNVDSDGAGGTDDEVACDEQCIPDGDNVDSDGAGGTDDEVACDEDTPRGDTDDNDDESDDDGDVLGGDTEDNPTGGETVGVPGGVEAGTATVGGGAGAGAGAATAPSGSLPLTGGDVLGLTAMGAAALAVGGAMVRRSRVMRRNATTA
jgi:hypothetical protein